MSRLRRACQKTTGLENAYRRGLQALRSVDSRRVSCSEPQKLSGSVAVDDALQDSRPNEPRWDYAIGITRTGKGECVVWIEVHPASSQHVEQVLAKKAWLEVWLQNDAPEFRTLTRDSPSNDGTKTFVWVASGRVSLPPTSPQRRKVAQAGIHFAGEHFEIE